MDMVDAGLNVEPITGPPSKAFPIASKRFEECLITLPLALRTILPVDVMYDTDDPANPEVDEWFDYITPKKLAAGDGGMSLILFFGVIFCALCNAYTLGYMPITNRYVRAVLRPLGLVQPLVR